MIWQRIKPKFSWQVSGQGSSGKSVVELEKTVALMKRVVERVQRENDELKKAPGVVSNQQLDELRAENRILKVSGEAGTVACGLGSNLHSVNCCFRMNRASALS